MTALIGRPVLARDGVLGSLADVYLDRESWRVRYLVVDTGGEARDGHVLIVASCAELQRRGGIRVDLSAMQLEAGAGVWPAHDASWLDFRRVSSGRDFVGFRVEAEDGTAGRLADMLLDTGEWSIEYFVFELAEAGGVRRLLLPLDWVAAADPWVQRVRVRRTVRELRGSPQLDAAPD